MAPPPELVQSIRSAGGDLPAYDAVILHNLHQTGLLISELPTEKFAIQYV